MLSPQMPVSCIFCPSEGGAFKQTTNSRWAHLLCASWIPEVGVANTVYMEPIDNIEKIPASRWRLTCYICKLRVGACIQCETKNCFRAFHVTCARKAHLYMKSKLSKVSSSGGEVLVYRAHCHKHTPVRKSDSLLPIILTSMAFLSLLLRDQRWLTDFILALLPHYSVITRAWSILLERPRYLLAKD